MLAGAITEHHGEGRAGECSVGQSAGILHEFPGFTTVSHTPNGSEA